jgi:hypothetical protein|tara:strand:- start:1124 stop:1528 length:405 start_codon:yes stop_codon:yes gene_type:complete
MAQEKTPKELIEELYNLFSTFKGRMEDPNFIQIENALNKLVENQQDMKREIKEMKRQLLSPFDGVIVETKKNTEARILAEVEEAENQQILEEHKELMRFKSGFVKFAWALLTGIGGLIAILVTQALDLFKKTGG